MRSLADTASAGLPAPWPRKLLKRRSRERRTYPMRWTELWAGRISGWIGRRGGGVWSRRSNGYYWAQRWSAACGSGSSLCWPTFRSTSTPSLGPFAWPTVLLVGGLAAGLLLRVVIRPWVAIGAARRRRRVTSELLRRVETVAEDFVLAPLAGRADCLLSAAVHALTR